jgi:hypothetical protein
MRVNIWIVLAILTVLFGMTRYLRHQETTHICLDEPNASVCERLRPSPTKAGSQDFFHLRGRAALELRQEVKEPST